MKIVLFILMLFISNKLVVLNPIEYFLSSRDIECLIDNTYHEAYAEGSIGRQLVIKVVLNRAKKSSVCKEIYKPKQFSWTLSKKKIVSAKARGIIFNEILKVYQDESDIPEKFLNATHYHTTKVKPIWRLKLKKLGVHKNHIFYEK
jgi:N-acetylmuramoyl-L-alanine amidase